MNAVGRKQSAARRDAWHIKLIGVAQRHGYPPAMLLEIFSKTMDGLSLKRAEMTLNHFVDEGMPDVAQLLAEKMAMESCPDFAIGGRAFLARNERRAAAVNDDEMVQAGAAMRRNLLEAAHLSLTLSSLLAGHTDEVRCMALGMTASNLALQVAKEHAPTTSREEIIAGLRNMMVRWYDMDASPWLDYAQAERRVRELEKTMGATFERMASEMASEMQRRKESEKGQ